MDSKDHVAKSRESYTSGTPGSDSTAIAPQRVGPTPRASSADSRSSSRGTPQREAGGAKSTSLEGYEGSKSQIIFKESGAAVNIIRSPFKDSAMLDPKAMEGEVNIMDLVDRYEEQPTMVDAPLRKPPAKTLGGTRQARRRGRQPGISEETVFDNIEDDKSGRTKSEDYGKENETYENLPTPPNEKEKEKKKNMPKEGT
ncbi:hypothetical protein ANCCAN_04999 [Ancylostoma caninum]|uniref:Uncharacterized protein n=1 Tax=Ancylostoma caninum TaxID=29170 RepID=A0A368H0W6_ANCCA|nr:hypothetical protein ANCCAN_04999 [Ancylostoma caninum]